MNENHRSATRQVVLFFVLTYLISWPLMIAPALSRQDINESPWIVPYLLGVFVPSAVGIALTQLRGTTEERREFWRSALDPRRISWRWYAVIATLYAALYGLSHLGANWLLGENAGWETLADIARQPVTLLGLAAIMLVNGFAEELGWRGYALDRLQARWGATRASLILGLVHALWHTPLYWVVGSMQYESGAFSVGYWSFVVNVTINAVLITWIYNNTRRSTLSATLLHAMHNLSLNLALPLSEGAALISVALSAVAVAAVLLTHSPRTLLRTPASTRPAAERLPIAGD